MLGCNRMKKKTQRVIFIILNFIVVIGMIFFMVAPMFR